MYKHVTLALLAFASAAVAGCKVAPLDEDADTPVPQPPGSRAASTYVTPTPIPRIVGKPAPLLARAVVIPSTKLPSPNGYDLLVKAAKSIQRGGEGSPDTNEKLSPEEDLKRQRAFTQKNAASLQMMRQALKLPIVAPPQRSLRVLFGPYAGFRQLARLVAQENRVHAADGRPELAVEGALDVVQMGAALQNGADSLGMLVGAGVESIGRDNVTKFRGDLSAEQAGRAARRLESIEASRPSYAAVSQVAIWDSLSRLRDVFRDPVWKKSRATNDPKGFAALFKDERDKERLRKTSDQQIEANFWGTAQTVLARARQPYSASLPLVPDPADPLSTLFLSGETSRGVTRIRVSYERSSAANRLLQADLALQASVKPSSPYPDSLSALAPKYLRAVPRDPFAPASQLRYKRQGDSFLLYSVGPDGIDNGGEPIKGRGVSIDSIGDILPTS